MGQEQRRYYCVDCEQETLHARQVFDAPLGCIITLLTGCIFLPVWVIILMVQSGKPFLCQQCGLSYSRARLRNLEVDDDEEYDAEDEDEVNAPLGQVSHAIGSFFEIIGDVIIRFFKILASLPGAVVRASLAWYRSLPEWAVPIVWGVGITVPVVGMMFGIRWLMTR